LPISADEEGLLGGLDLEATLRTGRRTVRAGALARANGGVVYVDQLNLLPDAAANLLLAALDSGEARLEREGLSTSAPARFSLIGSYDPAEGAPRKHLLDRVAMLVILPSATDEAQRAEVVRRNLGNREQGTGNREQGVGKREQGTGKRSRSNPRPLTPDPYEEELELLQGLVLAAREQLPLVTISDEQIEQLAAAALAFGVEGHRADAFAVHAACAAAALGLRDEVDQADLELAVRLVILPRATRIPTKEEQQPTNDERPPTTDHRPPEKQEPESDNQENPPENDTPDPQPPAPEPLEEQVLTALATELPEELSALPFRVLRRGRAGSRGSTSGTRGRHVRSVPGDPRHARVDIAATLRAAAPWQHIRDQGSGIRDQEGGREAGSGKREQKKTVHVRPLTPDPRPLRLRADDLRIKQFKSKAGALFCFAVDASGSMALHRMRQAKGAVHALLQQAYVHRDRVALIAFRGEGAELLLPPSQSVELARRALDLLPTGGGTPLAAALLRAIDVAQQARSRGILQTVLVLLTDGRGNVGLRAGREGINEELRTIGRHVAESGIRSIVVDTQRSYLSRGEARKLAEWLGGTYVYLPNAKGEDIAALANDTVKG
jgi:magnesium chelatase subunit D